MSLWARAWLFATGWFDGWGVPETADFGGERAMLSGRQVVAWALSCLARLGENWYELEDFIAAIYQAQQHTTIRIDSTNSVWLPNLASEFDLEKMIGPTRQRAWWLGTTAMWYANVVMVTLVELGLVERGRVGPPGRACYAFRLTPTGRAVFGAPEVPQPSEPWVQRFVVVQPNFDVVAYLDRADPQAAAVLGWMAETGAGHSGPIQTLRLTQASVYQAQEGGLDHAGIVDFLNRHGQREIPTNVLRSLADWSGKRESLTLRSGVTLVGFPSEAARDLYLEGHPGTACGERFVLDPGHRQRPEGLEYSQCIIVDASMGFRLTWVMDETGQIKATKPLDIVQAARLRRLAEANSSGWRITGRSVWGAIAGGMKPAFVEEWLSEHIRDPIPPLMRFAINQWLGSSRPLELGEAVLLHVPDDAHFRALAQSPRLSPFFLGSPGPRWLAVKRESRKALAAVLQELGFLVNKELSLNPNPSGKKEK